VGPKASFEKQKKFPLRRHSNPGSEYYPCGFDKGVIAGFKQPAGAMCRAFKVFSNFLHPSGLYS
jgi:hypothetical protein